MFTMNHLEKILKIIFLLLPNIDTDQSSLG